MRNTIIFILISTYMYTLMHPAYGKPVQAEEAKSVANKTINQINQLTKFGTDNLETILNYVLGILRGNQTLRTHLNLFEGNYTTENLTKKAPYHIPELMPPSLDGYPVFRRYGFPYTMPRYLTPVSGAHIIPNLNGHPVPAAVDNLLPGLDGYAAPVVDESFGLDGHPVGVGDDFLDPGLDGYPVLKETDPSGQDNYGFVPNGRRFSITFKKY